MAAAMKLLIFNAIWVRFLFGATENYLHDWPSRHMYQKQLEWIKTVGDI